MAQLILNSDIISDKLWEELINLLNNNTDINFIYNFVEEKTSYYNLEIKIFIKDFIYYLLCNKDYATKENWITMFKFVIHHDNASENYLLLFVLRRLTELYKEL